VGYPILNLGAIRRDVVWYVRMLEEVMIRATLNSGLQQSALRADGNLVRYENAEEKVAAIGVHISRWVTSHGFAYNVSTDLRYFDLIVPCGIADSKATSLERLLGRSVRREEIAPRIAKHFGEVFGLELRESSKTELWEKLQQVEQPLAASA